MEHNIGLVLLLQAASAGALLLRPTLSLRSGTSLRRPPTIVAQESEDVKSQFEGAVRKFTGKQDYEFGDFFIKPTKQVVTEVVTDFTGKENYQFGDITNKVLGDADRALTDWRDESLVDLLPLKLIGDLSVSQRQAILAAVLQLGTTGLLAYSSVANAVRGCTVAAVWATISLTHGASPLAPGHWACFITTHDTLCLAFEPLMLPLCAGLTLLVALPYRKLVLDLQRRIPWHERRPLVSAAIVLGLTYGAGMALVAGLSTAVIAMTGAVIGVPAFR